MTNSGGAILNRRPEFEKRRAVLADGAYRGLESCAPFCPPATHPGLNYCPQPMASLAVIFRLDPLAFFARRLLFRLYLAVFPLPRFQVCAFARKSGANLLPMFFAQLL